MAETEVIPSAQAKKRGWLKWLAWFVGAFVLLVIVAYFVGTSSALFKGVILPRVGKSMNAEVTVDDASISPFSAVTLRNLKVRTTGDQPLVSAAEVRLRYSLMDIVGGIIHVEEVTLASPTVVLVENPDGTSNLDPILKSQQAQPKEAKPAQPAKPSKPLQVDLKKLALTDATVRKVKLYKNGNRDEMELSHVNVSVDGVKNGQSGKLGMDADVKVENRAMAPGTNGLLQAKIKGAFDFALTGDLKPASIQGKTRMDITQATGSMADVSGIAAELGCDVTPKELKQVALRFEKNGTRLGQVLVSGPFDMEKSEGKLNVQIISIDKQVLNLAGAKSGVDFGTTVISSTNDVELSKGGAQFSLKGLLNVAKLQIVRDGQEIPAVDLLARYEITPTEIKEAALIFEKDGKSVGQISVSGPFSTEKKEGRLTLQISSIDKQVLNLAGAKSGIDFGTTAINSTNVIEIANAGSLVKVTGQIALDKFEIIRTNQATPSMDLVASFDETADLNAKTNLLRTFTVLAQQRGNPLLKAELTSPMTVSWGNVTDSVGDAALKLTLTHLNLADWKPFVGDLAPVGDANLNLTLLSQQAGKKISFDLDAHTDNLTAGSGTNQITQANVILKARGEAADLKQFNLGEYTLQVSRQNETLVKVSGSAKYDAATTNADAQVTAQIMLASLFKAMPASDAQVSSGVAELKVHVVQAAPAQSVTGQLTLTDFTGKFGKNEFHSFGSAMDLDIGANPQQAQVRKLSGKLTQGSNPGGSFDLSATYDLTKKSAQFMAKLFDFNQDGLRPFLEPLLADKKLVSIGINANASGQYDPKGDTAIKANLQVANLVVNDPQNKIPATPLEAMLQVDASMRNQVADVRQFQIGLTPTPRGTNQLQFTGHVDMSNTNAIQGNLKLAADSLDVTTYYDLFAGQKKTPEQTKPASATRKAPAPSTASADANKEPDAMNLPIRDSTAEVSIGRFYLHEVEITNLLATTKINGGRVLLNPFKLVLNGAPIDATADVDVGVPGYKYDVTFNGQGIPLAPLVNTFEPERKGQIGGTLGAQAKIAGAGTTGASLKKSLTGQFNITSTNLNLSVVNIKSALLKTLINVVAAIPELARNPAAVIGAAFGKGGLSDDLAKSPIDTISARGVAGSGKVELQQSLVQSAAFKAEAPGTVTLADVLTNSPIQFPVSVYLSHAISAKLNLASANTPTNEAYVKLPDFVTMKGTVGDPKADINKIALAGTAFKSIGGIVTGLGGSSGNLIKSAGDLLTGTRSSTNAPATTTNQPTQSPVNDLLNQFLKPKKK